MPAARYSSQPDRMATCGSQSATGTKSDKLLQRDSSQSFHSKPEASHMASQRDRMATCGSPSYLATRSGKSARRDKSRNISFPRQQAIRLGSPKAPTEIYGL